MNQNDRGLSSYIPINNGDIFMRIAISGKGGTGKTTLSAALAGCYAVNGRKVLAIDADPDGNLANAIGIPQTLAAQIVPVSSMKKLIEERTGTSKDVSGFFKLNPVVGDLLDKFGVLFNGIRFLSIGTVEKGAGGCMCPANILLRNLIQYLLLDKDEGVLIMDMDAGIEHLGRATVRCVNALVVVVEPGQRSVQTARSVERLARDIGIKDILVVCNKIRSPHEYSILTNSLQGLKILGYIPYNEELIEQDLLGKGIVDNPKLRIDIMKIKTALERQVSLTDEQGQTLSLPIQYP